VLASYAAGIICEINIVNGFPPLGQISLRKKRKKKKKNNYCMSLIWGNCAMVRLTKRENKELEGN
jgi:hypothetical protein